MHCVILVMYCFSACQIKPITEERTKQTNDFSEENHLIQSLSAIPSGANHVEFIDWARIKQYEGYEDVTSESNQERFYDFMKASSQYHVTIGAYAIMDFKRHKDKWSWNTADLVWEASLSISYPPSYILKFRNDFDFTPVVEHFEQRGFNHQIYHDIDIYTHQLEVGANWMPLGEFAILNTAIIPEDKLIMMSISDQVLFEMIDAYQNRGESLVDIDSVVSVVSELNNPFAAFLSADVCSAFSSHEMLETPALQFNQEELATQLEKRPTLHPYQSLGIGYQYVNDFPVGKVVLQFQTAEQVKDDLAARKSLATEGMTFDKKPVPYSKVYFELLGIDTNDSQLIMQIEPIDEQPERIFLMAGRMDMMFATCP